MKSKGEQYHDSLVLDLEQRLLTERDYDQIWTFMEYCRNGKCGEVDLLAKSTEYEINLFDFYEVKSTLSRKSRRRAKDQFQRYQLAYPRQIVKGYLYCGEDILDL